MANPGLTTTWKWNFGGCWWPGQKLP